MNINKAKNTEFLTAIFNAAGFVLIPDEAGGLDVVRKDAPSETLYNIDFDGEEFYASRWTCTPASWEEPEDWHSVEIGTANSPGKIARMILEAEALNRINTIVDCVTEDFIDRDTRQLELTSVIY